MGGGSGRDVFVESSPHEISETGLRVQVNKPVSGRGDSGPSSVWAAAMSLIVWLVQVQR